MISVKFPDSLSFCIESSVYDLLACEERTYRKMCEKEKAALKLLIRFLMHWDKVISSGFSKQLMM